MQYTLIIEDRNGLIANELSFDNGSFVIGRSTDCDIELASNSVSRQHALVFTRNGRCFIEDQNSSNGILLDGQRIQGASELQPGSQIRIGDFLLFLKTQNSEEPAPGSPPYGQVHPAGTNQFARIIRIGDIYEGETHFLDQPETTVGRTDGNHIIFSDPSISRGHAKIVNEGGRFVLIDLRSSNGSRINDHVVYQPLLLSHGDLVRFGNVRTVFSAPGEEVNLAEYSRMLIGSSRGLIVAVTVLALLLVLVASGIAAFVLLDRPIQANIAASAPNETSPVEVALQRKVEGDALAAASRWQDAMDKYRVALDLDPSLAEAESALAYVEAEFQASRIMQEVDIYIESGSQLETENNLTEALQIYDRGRERLQQIPSDSSYHGRAQDRVTVLIDPFLINIHRRLGSQEAGFQRYTGAIDHFQQALDIWSALPSDRRANINDDIRANLWRNMISAGDAAYEANDWAGAIGFYERAQPIVELPEAVEQRLRRARRQ